MWRQARHRTAAGLLAAAVTLAAVVPSSAAPSPAPPFTLEGLNGGPISLAAYRGSPVILLFWAPW